MARQIGSKATRMNHSEKQVGQSPGESLTHKIGHLGPEDYRKRLKSAEEELSLLKKSIETISTGITIADATGTIIYTNPAEARMHGYKVSELLGKKVIIFSSGGRSRRKGKKDLLRWKEWVRETTGVRKDGTTFPVRLKSRPVKYAKQDSDFIITISEDITEIKRVEEDLLRAHQELEQRVRERTSELERELRERKIAEERVRILAKFIENTNEAVIITGVSGRILDINDAFVEITGYTKEEVIGKKPPIFVTTRPCNNGFSSEIWKPLLRDGNWQGEIWGRKKAENYILSGFLSAPYEMIKAKLRGMLLSRRIFHKSSRQRSALSIWPITIP